MSKCTTQPAVPTPLTAPHATNPLPPRVYYKTYRFGISGDESTIGDSLRFRLPSFETTILPATPNPPPFSLPLKRKISSAATRKIFCTQSALRGHFFSLVRTRAQHLRTVFVADVVVFFFANVDRISDLHRCTWFCHREFPTKYTRDITARGSRTFCMGGHDCFGGDELRKNARKDLLFAQKFTRNTTQIRRRQRFSHRPRTCVRCSSNC